MPQIDSLAGRDKAVAPAAVSVSSITEAVKSSGSSADEAVRASTSEAAHTGVESWLTELRLATYAGNFASHGYSNLSQVW